NIIRRLGRPSGQHPIPPFGGPAVPAPPSPPPERRSRDIQISRQVRRPRPPEQPAYSPVSVRDGAEERAIHPSVVLEEREQEIRDANSPVYRIDLRRDLRRKAVEGMIWAEIMKPPRALAW